MSVLFHKNSHVKSVACGKELEQNIAHFSFEKAQEVREYHASFAEYAPTQLHALPHLAQYLGLKNFFLKDESTRFGLKAFKVLGASHAMGRYLAKALGKDFSQVTAEYLCNEDVRTQLGKMIFTSTTDGNHGRGVAWTAQKLQQEARIFMPYGSEQGRVTNITDLGASCTVTDLNYDATVAKTWEEAQEKGHILVQDTSWEGYEDIPLWIKQGYLTLGLEALEQMQAMEVLPTHVFLQAGVGSFPAAMVAFFHAVLQEKAPKCIIMEPHSANCIYTSAAAGDGNAHTVTGDLTSLMAGLACGKPCMQSWPILRDYATAYFSCPDYFAAHGMRILAAPLRNCDCTEEKAQDRAIVAGESGASTTGLVHWLMTDESAREYRQVLQLNSESNVLCISTEGDTVPEIYRSVVWQGAYGQPD